MVMSGVQYTLVTVASDTAANLLINLQSVYRVTLILFAYRDQLHCEVPDEYHI